MNGSTKRRRKTYGREEQNKPETNRFVARFNASERDHNCGAFNGDGVVGQGYGGLGHGRTVAVYDPPRSTPPYVVATAINVGIFSAMNGLEEAT